MSRPLVVVQQRDTYKAGQGFEKKPQIYCTFGQANTPAVGL